MCFLPTYGVRLLGSRIDFFGLNRNNLRNAPKVVFQAELEKLERELNKLNDQSAATSDKEEKSKLIERLSKVEK